MAGCRLSELCRMFGISPPTGYLWIRRYRDAGHDLRALQDRSRRPHSNPRAIAPHVEEFIVDARKSGRVGARASCGRGSPIATPAVFGRARAASPISSSDEASQCRVDDEDASCR